MQARSFEPNTSWILWISVCVVLVYGIYAWNTFLDNFLVASCLLIQLQKKILDSDSE